MTAPLISRNACPAVDQSALPIPHLEGRQRQNEVGELGNACVSAALARVGQELMRSLAKPVLFERLCRVAAETLASDASCTLLREKGCRSFVPVAHHGEARRFAYLADPAHPLATSVRERLASASVLEISIPTDAQSIGPTHSLWLCIALRRGAKLAGILVVGRLAGAPPFSRDDLRIAEGIGRLASLGLENARLMAELGRANRVKSDFAATMSHELRTPLNIIVGYVSLVAEGEFGPVSAQQCEALQHVDRSARSLVDLVQDTLDLSRLERDTLPVDRRDVHVGTLLDALEKDVQRVSRTPGVTLSWQVSDDVPAVFTDAGKLKIILRSLISNALKFTQHGSVAIAARTCGDGVEISVTDTGVGLARSAFARIFEPFTQLGEASTRTHGGVGMGLYIARRLVELLGGTIGVSSRVGVGSTFQVWIPAVVSTACDSVPSAAVRA